MEDEYGLYIPPRPIPGIWRSKLIVRWWRLKQLIRKWLR